jgi:hypothetical protein
VPLKTSEVVLTQQQDSEFNYLDLFSYSAILLLPFLLLQINDSWIFSKPTLFVDSWVYSGLHLHLREFLKAFGETYYASRVPWTMPGWLLHSIFDDEHALYVLHFGVFYFACLSLYYAIRSIFSNRAAAFATILVMGTQSYFLYAIGWDYVDGVSITWVLASIAALSGAAIRKHWRIAAIVWGATICVTVSLYILLVLFVPIEIGMFVLLNRFAGKRPLAAVGALTFSGGVAATVGMGLINWRLGGPFLYILAQFDVLPAVAANRFRYDLPLTQWVWTSPWLLLPAIGFAFSSLFVWLHRKSVLQKLRSADSTLDWEISQYVCCLADLAASLMFVGLEVDHFYVLQIDYRANSLLPFVFLVIGGTLAAICKPLYRARELGVFVALAAIALAPWVLANHGLIFPREELFQANPMLVVGWIIGGAVLMAFVVQRLYRGTAAAVLIVFFSIISVGAPIAVFAFPPNPAYKQQTLAVFDASREVARYDSDVRARFWFDLNDPDGRDFRDVASTYLYEYSLVNEAFPKLAAADGRRAPIAPGDRIIFLTSRGNPISLANAALSDENIVFDQVAEIPIHRPGVAFTIVVADAKTDRSRTASVVVGDDAWPETLRLGPPTSKDVSLVGLATRQLFRSDMDTDSGWEINRYGSSGGLSIHPSCLSAGDSCGQYSSGDTRDHLASHFLALPAGKPALVFFSIWVKPLQEAGKFRVFLQNKDYELLAGSGELATRNDGWKLYGGWLDVSNAQELRIVVIDSVGSTLLLDKAELVEVTTDHPVRPREEKQE